MWVKEAQNTTLSLPLCRRGLKKTRESGAVQERTALPVKESLRAYVEILQHLLQVLGSWQER